MCFAAAHSDVIYGKVGWVPKAVDVDGLNVLVRSFVAIWPQRGLQPVVLGIGATRPRRSAPGSVNQIEVQSGPTVTPAGPRLEACAR